VNGLVAKLIFLFLIIGSLSHADALLGLDYILFTDKNTVESDTSSTSSKTMYAFNVQFSINQKKNFYLGWALYNVTTKDDVNQQKSNYATADMGPSFRYEFGRSGLYFVNFIYGIRTQTTFDTGGISEQWLGTNYLMQFGVSPEISDNFLVSFAFNYFSGGSSKKVVSDVQTSVSYSKAFMTPTVGINYKW
jgi:hypothetical protein